MVFVDGLEGDMGRVVLYDSDVRGQRYHQWQRELQVASPALLLAAQRLVELSEELHNPLLSATVASRRVLDGE